MQVNLWQLVILSDELGILLEQSCTANIPTDRNRNTSPNRHSNGNIFTRISLTLIKGCIALMKRIKNENDGKKNLHGIRWNGIRQNGIRRNGKTPKKILWTRFFALVFVLVYSEWSFPPFKEKRQFLYTDNKMVTVYLCNIVLLDNVFSDAVYADCFAAFATARKWRYWCGVAPTYPGLWG